MFTALERVQAARATEARFAEMAGKAGFTAFFARGGRTGKKLHLGRSGSSVLSCGHWCKVNVSAFAVSDFLGEQVATTRPQNLCEKCFAGCKELSS